MKLQESLLFFLSLYSGYKVFNFGHYLKPNLYWRVIFLTYMSLFLTVLSNEKLFFLLDLLYLFPLTTGVVGFCFSFFKSERRKLDELNKIMIFYDLIGVNLRFGKSLFTSIESSFYVLGIENKKKENVCKNVVMQQLRSSLSPNFHELSHELEKLYELKVGLMDLVSFNKETIKYKYFFFQKKSAALSQFYIQVLIVGFMWLICITYLFLTKQVVENKNLICISLFLILIGFKLSLFLFRKSDL